MGLLLRVVFTGQPFHDVKVARSVQRDGVLVEQVWGEDKVAIGGKLVGNQLGIVESVADDIGNAGQGRISLGEELGGRGHRTVEWHFQSTCSQAN